MGISIVGALITLILDKRTLGCFKIASKTIGANKMKSASRSTSKLQLLLAGTVGYLAAFLTFFLVDKERLNSLRFGQVDIEHYSSSRLLNEPAVEDVKAAEFHGASTGLGLEDASVDFAVEQSADIEVETAILSIILFLIFLTILFEKLKTHIYASADKTLEPVVEALFGELAILGFVSGVSFVLTQVGAFSSLSHAMHHEENDGENEPGFHGDNEMWEEEQTFEKEDMELVELFEFVHYYLFLIMLFFVILVLFLIKEARLLEEHWGQLDRACQDSEYMARVYNQMHRCKYDANNLYARFFSNLEAKKKTIYETLQELIIFDGVRRDFLMERQPNRPFLPTEESHRVETTFSYGRYLSICLGEILEHVVDVKPITWLCFGFLAIFYYFFMLVVQSNTLVFAWTWAASGWALCLFAKIFNFHIMSILQAHRAPSIHSPGLDSCKSLPSERKGLLDTSNYTDNHTFSPSAEQELPPWCFIDIDGYLAARGPLTKWLSPVPPTRRDTLYWGERKGPELYLVLFQFKLVFFSAYFALLFLSFYPLILSLEDYHYLTIYVLVSVMPVVIFWCSIRQSIANFAQACSIGEHRRPQAVSEVHRFEKTEQLIRSILVIEKIHRAANDDLFVFDEIPPFAAGRSLPVQSQDCTEGSHSRDNARKTYSRSDSKRSAISMSNSVITLDTVETREAEKVFNSFDKSGDGAIQASEFGDLMRALGMPLSEDRLERIIAQLDLDGDGEIRLDEFMAFYAVGNLQSLELSQGSGCDLGTSDLIRRNDSVGGAAAFIDDFKELGRFVFELFDRDSSGDVSLGEFKQVLDTLNVEFTIDEVGDLVKELDHHGNGVLHEGDFVQLLQEHRSLFEEQPLPAIE